MDGISFKAIFYQAKTMIDGGWRVTFDVSADELNQMTKLVTVKDKLLMLGVVPIQEEQSEKSNLSY